MTPDKAAHTIQRFFAKYSSKKSTEKQNALVGSPEEKLLKAFDLRFQCMRAVACAKFPIKKPIEDSAQVLRVIESIRALASQKGIANLNAVEQVFRQNILLAERIQKPYYHVIWQKTYMGGVNESQLTTNAYKELQHIVEVNNLPIRCIDRKKSYDSPDVLSLAREVIQFASTEIIKVLAEFKQQGHLVSPKALANTFEKILSEYMTPTMLQHSRESIQTLGHELAKCSVPASKL